MRSKDGISVTHGEHHVAQKFTRRNFPSKFCRVTFFFPSKKVVVGAIAGNSATDIDLCNSLDQAILPVINKAITRIVLAKKSIIY